MCYLWDIDVPPLAMISTGRHGPRTRRSLIQMGGKYHAAPRDIFHIFIVQLVLIKITTMLLVPRV